MQNGFHLVYFSFEIDFVAWVAASLLYTSQAGPRQKTVAQEDGVDETFSCSRSIHLGHFPFFHNSDHAIVILVLAILTLILPDVMTDPIECRPGSSYSKAPDLKGKAGRSAKGVGLGYMMGLAMWGKP